LFSLSQSFRGKTDEERFRAKETLTGEMEVHEDLFSVSQSKVKAEEESFRAKETLTGEMQARENLFGFPQSFETGTTEENRLRAKEPLTGEMEAREDFRKSSQFFGIGSGELIDKIDWEVGDAIDGKYEVLEILGQGGMGIVYKIYHREWDLDLAVKMPLPPLVANDVLKARFILEAQTWVHLGLHPNIVQCWYVRELGGIPRVFMDYLDGGSLKDWMIEGKVKPGEWHKILDLVIQACDGLRYAHEHGVEAHRDVKPGNMLLTKEGELRVADFGIVKRQGRADIEGKAITVSLSGKQHTVTVTGSDLGTPEYGAPEQWGEARHADARADIYALGGVLFELCCGRRPFDDPFRREQPHVLIGRHLFSPAPDPRKFNKKMPKDLAELLLRCLEKEPDDRPDSMAELRERLLGIYKRVVGKPYGRMIPEAGELRSSILNNRAISLLDLGKREEAFATLEEALKLDVHHAESVYNKSLLEWREERITDDEVVRRLKEAKQVSWRAGLYLGFVYLERAAADKAEDALAEALHHESAKRDGLAWRALGDALMAQEKYSEASEAYQNALKRIPGDSATLRGKMLAQKRTRWQKDGQVIFPWPRCLRTLVGYKDKPDTAALTSDGRFAILGDNEGIRLWDLATGRYFWTFSWFESGGFWTFRGYANSVTSVEVTPDGKFAVCGGSNDTSVRLWELATGKCLRIFEGHEDGVRVVTITPDGQRAVSGSLDKTVRIWDLATGECLQILKEQEDPVNALAVTSDGQSILAGGGKELRFWDLKTGKYLRRFRGHKDEINTIAITPDGRFVVSGSRDKTLRLWELATGRHVRTLAGHVSSVTTLAVTPDGRFAISGSLDTNLRVWDLSTGACLRILKGHDNSVTAVAVTPDGHLAVSVSRDKTVRQWDLKTGKCLQTFTGYTYWLEAIALISNGRFAIIGSNDEMRLKDFTKDEYLQIFRKTGGHSAMLGRGDESLRLWNIPPGECFLTIQNRRDEKINVAVTPDGRFAVSGGKNETLQLWDLLSGKCLWIFRGQKAFKFSKKSKALMNCVAVTIDERFAVSGGYDAHVRLWDLSTGECLRTFEGHEERVSAVAVTSDGRFAVSGSFDTTLRLWDLTIGECLQTFNGHEGIVTAVAITPDGRFVVSGSSDKTLRLWDLSTGKCLRTFEGHVERVTAVAITPDGQFALSASNDKTLRLWVLDAEARRPRVALQVCRHQDLMELQMFRERFRRYLDRAESARRESKIATAYTFLALARAVPGYERDPEALALNAALSRNLQRESLREGRLLRSLEGHEDYVTAVAITPDGRFAISGSRDKTVRLWALATGECLRTFKGHEGSVTCVAVTPDRHLVVSGGRDNTLRLWALATGECLKTFTGHEDYVMSVAITSDGRFAVSGSSDKTLRLWSLKTDDHLQLFEGLSLPIEDAYKSAELATNKSLRTFRGHKWDVDAVAVTLDGSFAISGSHDNNLRLWNLATGRCLQLFKGHEDYVTAVAVTPEGRFAISGSRDKTLRLWSLKTGKCLRVFRGHEDYVSSVAVTLDGRFAISGSWDRTLRLWRLTKRECVRVFERHEDIVETVAMTPDGRFAISGSRDNTLRVWEFDWKLTLGRNIKS
jgi:WD40 repeat protein/serine/threonine protein kinase